MNITTRTSASPVVGAVLGHPIDHSLSPALQAVAFEKHDLRGAFVAIDTQQDTLLPVLEDLEKKGAYGVSITVPHKQAVANLCDTIDPIASAVGAINCIRFDKRMDGKPGQRSGWNTDVTGFISALDNHRAIEIAPGPASNLTTIQPPPPVAIVLGAGGAARAIAYGLKQKGYSVHVFARSSSTWTHTIAFSTDKLAKVFAQSALVIDCTPVGLSASTDNTYPCEIPLNLLPKKALVCSLIYHRTPWILRSAQTLGLATMTGLEMLLYQGACAFTIWTGKPAPIEDMRSALTFAIKNQQTK